MSKYAYRKEPEYTAFAAYMAAPFSELSANDEGRNDPRRMCLIDDMGVPEELLFMLWKASHREAQLATVAPAVDAQPVAWFIADDNGEVYRSTGYEHERDQWRAVGHAVFPLYASAQSEGWRKDAWQLIETAPKDGTEVLLIATRHSMLMPHPERIVGAYRNGWWSGPSTLSHVTHWMPLPEAPAALSQQDPQ